MYTLVIIIFFLLFIKKISSYIKKISLFFNFSEKNFFAKYKNSKPKAKFIIK